MAAPSTFPLLFVLSTLLISLNSAAPSAPAPAVDCSSLVLNMADCLSFVTAGSTTKKPEGTCCSGLKTVLKSDAECLCEAFKNSAQLGVTLNVTKALTLPAACHVSAPSVSNCGLSTGTGTGAAPALPPMAVTPPTSSVAGAPVASIGANDAAPVPAPGTLGASGSSALATTFELLGFTTAAAVSFTLF